jgi:hypothetical protein
MKAGDIVHRVIGSPLRCIVRSVDGETAQVRIVRKDNQPDKRHPYGFTVLTKNFVVEGARPMEGEE